MNTLRTFIRFALILIFLILLVVLSIFLFKLIPKGINQLATASLSLTGLEEATTTVNPLIENRIPQPVATTTGGLNGVISTPTNTGGITILENTPKTITTVKRTYTAPSRTVYYPIYTKSGYKNIKVSLISTGIIDRNSGQFVSTNSFNTNDVISIRYKLENDQDTDTGFFTMRVDMPALDANDRVMYKSLTIPGNSAYQVEARFDGIDVNSSPVVRVYTDTGNQVSETNESDNTLSVTLNNIINNYNYNNNNNCYWLNGYYYCNSNNNNNNCYYQNGYYNCDSNNTYQPNLTISSIEVGKMINNSFSPQTNFIYGDRVALRVRVRNNGGTFTNNWSTRTTYSDTMGTNRSTVTDNERPINPGAETLLVIQSLDTLNRGTTILNFNLDSNNNVYESNESDNNASVNVYVY